MSATVKKVEVEEMGGVIRHIQPQVEVEKKKQRVVRRVKKQKKKGLYSIQGLLAFSFVAGFGILFGQLYLDSQISQIHYETQTLQQNISIQTNVNEQFYAKIAELSMYSRVVEIAASHDLDYQEGNVISIGE